MFSYAFYMPSTLNDYGDIRYFDTGADYILILTDAHFRWDFGEDRVKKVYEATDSVAAFEGDVLRYDQRIYPYTNMEFNGEGGLIEARIGPASVLSPKGIFK